MAQLVGSGSYAPIPQARPMVYSSPSYKPVLSGGGSTLSSGLTADMFDFGVKPTPLSKLSTVGNVLQGLGGIITNQLYNWFGEPELNWKDIPLADFLVNFDKGARKSLLEDGFQWTDVFAALPPFSLVRGLEEVGKNTKTTRDILNARGWLTEAPADPNKGWNFFERRSNNLDYGDVLSFVGDVLLDPLTWITFGGAGVAKAGIQGATKAGAKQLAQAGIKTAIPRTARNSVDDIANFVAKEIGTKFGDEAATTAKVAVENAAKSARNIAQNAAISFDVPFTNISRPLVMKGANSPFRVVDPQIGEAGATAVRRMLDDLGMATQDQAQFLKRVYGVDTPQMMTTQMLEHLRQNIDKVKPGQDILEVFKPVTDEVFNYHYFSPDDILKNITDPAEQNYVKNLFENLDRTFTTPQILGNQRTLLNTLDDVRTVLPEQLIRRADELFDFALQAPAMVKQDEVLRSIDELLQAADAFRNAGHTAEIGFAPFERALVTVPNSAKTLQNAQNVFDVFKFAQDMGGVSRASSYFGNKLFRYINPRTAGSVDSFVNQAVGRIRDAETQIRGGLTQMGREMRQWKRLAKGLTEEDLSKIPYILEGKAPGGKTMDQFLANVTNKEQLMQVADYTRQMLRNMGMRELEAGAVKDLIDNYFPHVVKQELSKEQVKAILSDPVAQRYLGRNAVNQFANARTGPESFAAWDDMISKLEEALKQTTDPKEIAQINKKIDELNGLFERNTPIALAKRYQRNVYATAMGQLYGDLRNSGLILTIDDAKRMNVAFRQENYIPIPSDLAKKLNIKEITESGGYIHKEIAEALKKIDDLFTDEGLSKAFQFIESVTNIWRGLVTTPIPSHHINNFIGNVANNMLAGVSLLDYRRAANLIKKMKSGQLSAAERKLVQEAYDRGVLASGVLYEIADPFREAKLAEKGWLGKAERFARDNKLASFMREKIGDYIEDFTRMALYLSGKRKGLSAKQSADLVRKYLFNYAERTPTERAIRNFIPFWSWTKNNLPLQFQELMRQPRYYNTYRHLQQMVDDESETVKPDWVADYLKIPGVNYYINPRLPMSDITQVTEEPLQFVGNLLGPIPKSLIEAAVNREVFTGKPIDYSLEYEGKHDPLAWIDFILGHFGLPGRIWSAAHSQDPLSASMRILFPLWPVTYNEQRVINELLKAEG